jgi:SAM-dependent methyltransferase/uncharacterized protein YbaR (Trm112 family)
LDLLPLLACPICSRSLELKEKNGGGAEVSDGQLVCAQGHSFPVVDSVALLRNLQHASTASHDESLERTREEIAWHDQQAGVHDSDMPVDEAHVFSWLTYYQIFEMLPALRQWKVDSVLLGMCGCGFEFDVWGRVTRNVSGFDASGEAGKLARRRLDRLGLSGDVFAAEVEHIPLRDESFDIVSVHHGLHHTSDLSGAITELLRVARRAVVLFEPIDSPMRRVFKKLRISPAVEEGGTPVNDLRDPELLQIARATDSALSTTRLFYPKTGATRPTGWHKALDTMYFPKLLRWPLRCFNTYCGRWAGTKATIVFAKHSSGLHI